MSRNGERTRGRPRPAVVLAGLLASAFALAGPWSTDSAAQQTLGGAAPVALVENIEEAPKAGVDFLDYVYANQTIRLGRRGVLVLSYFESCVRETIRGGRVRVGPDQSAVNGGKVERETLACQGAQQVVSADASEAGGAVKRVTPFKEEEWREVTVKTGRPVFKWRPARKGDPMKVMVVDLEARPLRIVWQGETKAAYVAYPKDAPALAVGRPYLVQLTDGAGRQISAVFSFDPGLDVADTAVNRVVPVDR